ncbi:MAG: ATP-binding protein [Cyclobacteriaceae bacterium]
MLIVILGLTGTGKTYFAKRLAKALAWPHNNTDQARARLGLRENYSSEAKQQVYEELFAWTLNELSQTSGVVIDATFSQQRYRDQLVEQVAEKGYPIYFIEMTAEDDTIRERVSQDREDSEADMAVYLKMKKTYDPVKEPFLTFNSTYQSIEEMIDQTRTALSI